MEYKKQHYIPQSYLGSWCDINKPEIYDDYVWLFSYDGSNVKKKSPKNIFYETDMYTIYDEEGNRILDIEHGLAGLENSFVSVREEKLKKKLELSFEEKSIILAFIAAMHNRTPAIRDHISKSWGRVVDLAEEMKKAYKNASSSEKSKMRDMGPKHKSGNSISLEEAKMIHSQPLQTLMIPRIQAEAKVYNKMNMTILNTNDKVGFITSDYPCFWFDPDAYKRPPMYRSPGLANEKIEVIMPISPKQAILISHVELPLYISVDMTIVDSINRKIRFNANEYFVVNSNFKKEFWFKVLDPPQK